MVKKSDHFTLPIVSSQEEIFQRNSDKSPELRLQIRPSSGESRGDFTIGDYSPGPDPSTNVLESQYDEGINGGTNFGEEEKTPATCASKRNDAKEAPKDLNITHDQIFTGTCPHSSNLEICDKLDEEDTVKGKNGTSIHMLSDHKAHGLRTNDNGIPIHLVEDSN